MAASYRLAVLCLVTASGGRLQAQEPIDHIGLGLVSLHQQRDLPAALRHFEAAGLRGIVRDALGAASRRSEELGDQLAKAAG